MHPPKRVILGAVFVAVGSGQVHQIAEVFFIARIEHALFCAKAEHNFLAALKISWGLGHPRLGELETVQTEGKLREREDRDSTLRQNGLNARDRRCESFAN